jgi:hypothetical protein
LIYLTALKNLPIPEINRSRVDKYIKADKRKRKERKEKERKKKERY